MASARKRRRPVGETIGGIIVGFDQQVFRNLPPAHELVQKHAQVRGLSGEAGQELTIILGADPDVGDVSRHGSGLVRGDRLGGDELEGPGKLVVGKRRHLRGG